MARFLVVLAASHLLCTLASEPGKSCEKGESCDNGLDDDVSLMQLAGVVKQGKGPFKKAAKALSNYIGGSEGGELAELDEVVPELQCPFAGCFGYAPFCDGNANDCTSRGLAVGFFTTDWANCGKPCQSGQYVVCQDCGAGSTPEPGATIAPPTPAPPPTFPTQPTTTTGTTPTTGAPATLAPVSGVAPMSPLLLNDTQLAFANAAQNMEDLHQALDNATKQDADMAAKITKMREDIKEHTLRAQEDRAAAVRFAKEMALANQTMQRAALAMDDAQAGRDAAANMARVEESFANNAAANLTYYQKMQVDTKDAKDAAAKNLQLGKVALDKSYANLASAKRGQHDTDLFDRRKNNAQMEEISHGQVRAKETQVKDSMEEAFVSSSIDRNLNNTPSWGAESGAAKYGWGK